MDVCTSCKSRTSDLRCNRRSIRGLDVCGTHAKAKTRRNWYTVNNLNARLTKVQAMWRGFEIRNRLKKAGPGVLKRSMCHNEDELVSLEPIVKIHPFSYFSFEEGGKVWAFDIQSICNIFLNNVRPQNPYTRTPLLYETRHRLRAYYHYIARTTGKSIIQIPKKDQPSYQLTQVTQILQENGFDDFRSEYISVLTPEQAHVARAMLLYDMRGLAMSRPFSVQHKYCALLNNRRFMPNSHPTVALTEILAYILSDIRSQAEEYEFCFRIMSALYRI